MALNILDILKFSWQYRHAISGGIRGLPDFPESWKDSGQVRLWFQAILESPLCVGLVTDYPGNWDDKLRADLLALTNKNIVWETIWSFFSQTDEDDIPVPIPTPDKVTVRERLSKLFRFREHNAVFAENLLSTTSIAQAMQFAPTVADLTVTEEDTDDILTIISIMSLVTGLIRFIQDRRKRERPIRERRVK